MGIPSFKDPAARAAMDRNGYVVIPGFAEQLVPRLLSVYRDMLGAIPVADPYFQLPMTGTNWIGTLALRARVLAEVGQIIAPALASILENHRLIGAGFRVKQVGEESHLPLHQDPTQVDEERYWIMNIIVPLVDTSRENGALQVVPGSHRIMPRLRSLDLLDRAETWNLHEVIEPLVETIPMRAGDAIFYFQSILHGSGPNAATDARPVVLGTMLPRDARVTVYFRKPDQPSVFECYEVPDDYFNQMEDFNRDHKLRPKVGRRLEDVPDTYNLSRDEIIAAFRAR
jgi:ectoine hydroxylase-related dioxygenase (phytanoyl-CoA dioxygenase family)